MKRNKQQQAAIDSTGNIIVSAGAGSGKTDVLTERIVKNICDLKNGVHLDEILILTFTDNAAAEMRGRLKEGLAKKEETKSLVPLVDSANISTFDAYFLFLVQKYASRLGISNNISIIPDDIIKVKKNEVLQGFISKMADNPSEVDEIIFQNYCKKNDDAFIKFLLRIDNEFGDIKDFNSLIDEYKTKILTDEGTEYFINNVVMKGVLSYWDEILSLRNQVLDEDYVEKFDTKFNQILYDRSFESFNSFFKHGFKVVSNKKGTLSYKIKNKINGMCSNLYTKFKGINIDERMKVDFEYNKIVIPKALELVRDLEVEISAFKHEKGAYTFSDIARMAFDLLKDNPDIALSIKNKLKLIMIDEYQDTSTAQEEFINMIANNNVFVVGDVKQSIYGFRDANPKQFIRKYENYSKGIGGHAIPMNQNYRSRKEITDDVNEIFSKIMTKKYGGADYAKEHIIDHGNWTYEDPLVGTTPEIKGYEDKKTHGIFRLDFPVGNHTTSDEKVDLQIAAIIKDIKVRIQEHMQVFDRGVLPGKDTIVSKDGKYKKLRDVTYKDFAILCPYSTLFKKIEKEFNKAGVPINAVYDEDIQSDDGVIVLINILKMINGFNSENPEEYDCKHSMFSILRSFLYGKKDAELYELSKDDKYKELPEFAKIKDFAKRHKGSLIQETYLDILKEFNFLDRLPLIDDAINKLKYDRIFFERTQIMDDFGFDLKNFIDYLELLDDLGLTMKTRTSSDVKNAVTLTTIHKSKGLQYGIVYMPFINKKGGSDKIDEDRFFVHKKFGIALPSLSNYEFIDSKLINKSMHATFSDYFIDNDAASETIRVLYVALTRAREEIIILNEAIPEDDAENISDIMNEQLADDKTQEQEDFEYLQAESSEDEEKLELETKLANVKLIGDALNIYGLYNLQSEPYSNIELIEEEPEEEIEAKPSENTEIIDGFRYEFKTLPERKHASKVTVDLEKVSMKTLNAGTHLHLLLEGVNFKTKDTSFIKNDYERKKIDAVVHNPIFDGTENATFYKEYEYFDDINNMVGIIDLLIEKENEIIIIDYKTKNISDSDYDLQLNTYRDYIKRKFGDSKPIRCVLLSIIDNEIREIK